jgi:Type ISP C-terminal specificity domain
MTNATALRQSWPRIPLPASIEILRRSAELGRAVVELLDVDSEVTGVTQGQIQTDLAMIALASREGSGSLNPDAGDLDVTAGWGHFGLGGAVMPGKGKIVERDYTAKEREAITSGATARGLLEERAFELLGARTLDVYLNDIAYWRNIPSRVWEYTIGGYQVIKKWLSYREREILGRGLRTDEMRNVTEIARRIGAILLLQPELDTNYEAVSKSTYKFPHSANE